MIAVIVIVVLLVLIVGFVIVGFNKLRTTDIGAQEALGGIDVQLTRRADLIPNLVETVKGYAAHESGVFEAVTQARAGLAAAAKGDDVQAKAAADQALSQALVRVNAVAEAYPDLKANQNFQDLQNQLKDTEDKISFARTYYNDAVATLNKLVVTIPWMFLSGLAGVKTREFYEAPAGADVAPTVNFGTTPPAPPTPPAAPAAPPVPPAPPAAPAAPAAPPAASPAAPAPPAPPVTPPPAAEPPAAPEPPTAPPA
ncbi:LemA protein [Marmoricola sp. OAE513]|uniref:LemA family protein n=1 Tax=Marmoricola sp. OAE513 TaxID=2817894 RepID=UPI001AEA6B63